MLRIAGVQFAGNADKATNIEIAERMVRQAAARGAKIACLPELFEPEGRGDGRGERHPG
jgi:N-carbamoylputrescine amidase